MTTAPPVKKRGMNSLSMAGIVVGCSSSIKAARLGTDGRVTIEEVPRPTAGPGEALVRIVQAGVCNTDIEIISRG